MKRFLLFALVSTSGLPTFAQDIFAYDAETANRDNVGIFVSLGGNFSSSMVKRYEGWSHTAKGAMSIVPMIGGYFQKALDDRLSIRGSLAFGYSSYAFKYAQNFDSLTENFTPVISSKYSSYTKVGHGSAFVMPQVDLGYIFGPFKKMYLIEARAGVALHAYLSQSNDSVTTLSGSVTDSRYTYKYRIAEFAEYGQPDVWGSVLANGYIGIRWQKTTSELLNHMSLGIQATIPVYTDKVGYTEIQYKNNDYQIITRERVQMSLMSFSIRLGYNFF